MIQKIVAHLNLFLYCVFNSSADQTKLIYVAHKTSIQSYSGFEKP